MRSGYELCTSKIDSLEDMDRMLRLEMDMEDHQSALEERRNHCLFEI